MQTLLRTAGFLNTLRKTRNREDTLPRLLTYIVTYTCNAKCIMCDSWKMTGKDDLTLAEIEGIFKQLPKMDVVRLTGGEPFVRKDFAQIYALAQKHLQPFAFQITTNGFLTDRIVSFLEERDKSVPLYLLISIDGTRPTHNRIRGKETAWDTAFKTLQTIAPRKKELNLTLAINQTIVDPDGAAQYKPLHEIIQPMGIEHQVVIAYEQSATYSLERDKEVAPSEDGDYKTWGNFTREQLEELFRTLEADLGELSWKGQLIKRYYLKGIANRLLGQKGNPNPKCVALTAHMRLFPNGDVPVCQFNSKTVGNFRKENFEEIWYGKEIAGQRDWVRKCSGCWAECEVLPSALYTGDIAREAIVPHSSILNEIRKLPARPHVWETVTTPK
ncbi:MAG: radical SAM protein [Candidatus Sumerlaeia bacterium]|nr:radical SAM protein [Candidatus Sumerlaeia bacterium]